MKRFLTHVMVAALAAALAATWTAFAESGSGRDGSDDDGTSEVRQEDRRADDDGERRGRGRGRDDDDDLFESRLAPSDPADATLNGVQPGGLPWQLRRSSEVELERNGKLEVKLRGLVIPEPQGDGTAGGVNTVTASVFCGDSTTPADESGARNLSDAGNAKFKARLDLPDDCLAPTVFIHPNGDESRYIAVSGFKG